MAASKPSDIREYTVWLKNVLNAPIPANYDAYYSSAAQTIGSLFEAGPVWQDLPTTLRTASFDYNQEHGLALLTDSQSSPRLYLKPYSSFLEKTFRKNVVHDKQWPNPPEGGWLLPDNWFSRINDIVRTTLVVKYFDGVSYLSSRLQALASTHGVECQPFLEARMEDGYYASHLYFRSTYEIRTITWDIRSIDISAEIQITTQLQDVLRQLLHKYYEARRIGAKSQTKWQWDYKSNEFSANYLGHLLHYIEGMIVELRDKQKGQKQ